MTYLPRRRQWSKREFGITKRYGSLVVNFLSSYVLAKRKATAEELEARGESHDYPLAFLREPSPKFGPNLWTLTGGTCLIF